MVRTSDGGISKSCSGPSFTSERHIEAEDTTELVETVIDSGYAQSPRSGVSCRAMVSSPISYQSSSVKPVSLRKTVNVS
jgi:hypothetical protein